MTFLKRIGLLLLTNFLVMTTITIVWSFVSQFMGLNQMTDSLLPLAVLSLIVGMSGAGISLLLSKWMAKRMMGVTIIDPQTTDPEHRQVLQMVHSLAHKAGLTTMPEVGIYDAPELNAFATGPTKNNSLVAVSTGLLRSMNRDEVEGVLAHEVTHISNGDMVTMTLIQGVVNAFVFFFKEIVARIVSSQVDEKSRYIVYAITSFVAYIFFTFLGMIVVSYFSRRREYRADYGGAKYAGREKMIAGLRRLKSHVNEIAPDNGNLATMKISNRGGFLALLSTHPDLEDRIQRLQHTTIM